MTNKEHFKEELLEVACGGTHIAFDKETNKPCSCADISCFDCAFHKGDMKCKDAFIEWLKEEYKEPCPFEKGELVEVSVDGIDWCLRHFSHIDEENERRKFKAFVLGLDGKEIYGTSGWEYCRKYGTLGGLVKGE